MKKKLLATLLALAICLTIMPVTVFAADPKFNIADIAAINAIASAHQSLGMSLAFADGSESPDSWTGIVEWSASAAGKRVLTLNLNGKNIAAPLEVKDLSALETLNCQNTQLTGLTLANLPALSALDCQKNKLTGALDLSAFDKLDFLDCSHNELTLVKIHGSAPLTTIKVHHNYLASEEAVQGQDIDWLSGGLFKEFSPQCWRVKYDSNGGAGTMADGKATAVEQFTLPACAFTAPEGKEFDIWAIGSVIGTNVNPGEAHIFTADTTVYALWKDSASAGTYSVSDIAIANSIAERLGLPKAPANGSSVPAAWVGIIVWSGDDVTVQKRITQLFLGNKSMTGTLDVSSLQGLTYLNCSGNSLSSVKFRGLPALKHLDCSGNGLTGELDASGLTALEKLICNNNQLTSLNLSSLPSLTELNCSSNQLTGLLNISSLDSLTVLDCSTNLLTGVNLDENAPSHYTDIYLQRNCIESTSKIDNGAGIYWGNEGSSSFVFSPQRDSRTVTFHSNTTSMYTFTKKAFLELPFKFPECSFQSEPGKQFRHWAIGSAGSADTAKPSDTRMIDADIDVYAIWEDAAAPIFNANDIAVINTIIAVNKPIEMILQDPADGTAVNYTWSGVIVWSDAETDKRVEEIYLTARHMTGTLDVSGLPALKVLKCNGNALEGLNISGLTALTRLSCSENQLTSLDVSSLTALTELDCSENRLTSLIPGNLPALTELNCSYNRLTSIDVSGLPVLSVLICYDNRLTSVRLSGSAPYTFIDVSYNCLESKSKVTGRTINWDEPGSDFWFDDQRLKYTVTYSPGAGTGTMNPNTAVYEGLPLTLPACGFTAPAGYHFKHWAIGSADSETVANAGADYIFNGNTTVYAVWETTTLFNRDDIAAINAIVSAHPSLGMSEAPPDGSGVPGNWAGIVIWSFPDVDKRAEILNLIDKNINAPLEVKNLTALSSFNCHNSQLTGLTLENLPALSSLNCQKNKLTGALDLSAFDKLDILDCLDNELTSVIIHGSAPLTTIRVNYNYLESEAAVVGQDIQWDESGMNKIFTPQYRRITYDANGGTGNMDEGKATAGKLFTLPQCTFTAPEDKVFDTWAIGSADSATKVNAGDQHTFEADTTVFALWKDDTATKYNITVINGTANKSKAAEGEIITLTAVPPDGKLFAEWSLSPAASYAEGTNKYNNPAKIIMPAANFEATAVCLYEYSPADIAIINEFIENYHPTGMTKADPADGTAVPDDWEDNIIWDNDVLPKRVGILIINNLDLSGTLNLSGLEMLRQLSCSDNDLTGLNLSDLPALISLECRNNKLTGLNLSNLPALKYIDCSENKLTGTLDLTNFTNLETLFAEDNNLSFIDVSGLASFESLCCYNNKLTGFDASGTSLLALDCDNNLLTELDLSEFESLDYLYCSGNLLTSVKLNPDAPYSSGIDVRNNYLPGESAVSGKDGIIWDDGDPVKYRFNPQYLRITYDANGGSGTMNPNPPAAYIGMPFTLPPCTFTAPAGKVFDTWAIGSADSATKVNAGDQHTFEADTTVFALWKDAPTEYSISDIEAINAFIAANNLTMMTPQPSPDGSEVPDDWNGKVLWDEDVSPKRVENLIISDLGLSGTLKLSGLEMLRQLHCYGNDLTGLDLSDLPALRDLGCAKNDLTGKLDLTNLTNLISLEAEDNNLSFIDVSGLANLTELYCDDNELTGIDASYTGLETLFCENNLLTELDLSGLESLKYLVCSGNLLTSVKLNPDAVYIRIDVRNNYLPNTSAVTGKPGIEWDTEYFKFTPQNTPYTITYNANGGDGTMADGKAFQDIPFTLPANGFTAPAGKQFISWAIGSADSATKVNPGETHTFTADTAVFALWEDLPVPGTYDPGDIAIINEFVRNYHPTGMTEAPDDGSEVPDDWDNKVGWNNDSPKRINILKISNLGLSGTLNLSGLEKLLVLACHNNNLTGLNLSDLPALTDIVCAKNDLTGTLDLTNLTNLRSLMANENKLGFIDVSNLASFKYLYCYDNELTGFDASGTDLTALRCRNNLLTELDVSGFASLKSLVCSGNLLTSVKLNPDAPYSSGIDASDNYLADYSAVTGKDGISWDTGDPVLYKFSPQKATYAVTYNANGGGGSMAPGKAFQDIPFTLPANGFTAPAGKQFVSWAIGSPSGPKVYPGGKYTFARNTVVYAVWIDVLPPNTYFVTVINGSASAAAAKTGTVVTVTADPAKEGYRFLEWSIYPSVTFVGGATKNSPTASFVMPAGAVIAEAKYEVYDNYANNYTGGSSGNIGGSSGSSGGTTGPIAAPIPDPELPTEPTPEPEPVPQEPEAAPTFTDVFPSDWFAGAVAYVAERGIMQGTGDGLFSPNAPVTRAMLITMLYRFDGSPEVTANLPFIDVEPGSWYYAAIRWAYENEIVFGLSDTEFGAGLDITREQLVTILYRYALKRGLVGEYGVALDDFADKDQISPWAVEAMLWAKAEGIISGVSEDTLDPQGAASRAQIAAIFQRFMENITG